MVTYIFNYNIYGNKGRIVEMYPPHSFKSSEVYSKTMNLQPREYQEQIINSIQANGNTLVVLPTGLGKTLIALSLMEKATGKCIFLTPTKPLARQHTQTILDVLGNIDGGSVLVTGESPPKKRAELYQNKIISSTPQTIRNDIQKGIFPGEEVSLVVFDEAHRAVGDYAYVQIAEHIPPEAKIIALTASPGGDRAKIKEVLTNLRITNIEVRSPTDPDVSPYMKKMDYTWIPVELGKEYGEAKEILSRYIKKQVTLLRNMGVRPQIISKRAFLALRPKILKIKHPMKYRLIYLYTCLLHALHLQELLETQGKAPVYKYLEKLSKADSKSAKTVSSSQEVQKILSLLASSDDHPKMKKLLSLVSGLRGRKLIVFVQYRDQITQIVSEFEKQGVKARPFMGKRERFTRKIQEQTMDSFRKGEFDVLVASSIGEEGLDIPEVDAVIFYEPIPSEIRSIQRRGRAGRLREGAVYVLMTKSTRDEHYYWASKKREKKMKEVLLSFQEKFRAGKPLSAKKKKTRGQNTIMQFMG
ncbi:DEAD/DEAH box helicase [Candidatus Micrarchaeota archaeon]|nr:DEAD/DEAH box helicase [Candidatus Micrarchaeota archaeon]MBD3417727.1 DEAD/DEAH box helicase [Candidatus Micrarchaeota archaeon]